MVSVSRCFVSRDLPGPALARLRVEHEVEVWEGDGPIPRPQLLERAAAAQGLLAMLTDRVDEELLAAAPGLIAISNYAVGTDNVDLDAATRGGVPVGNTPDVLTDATADLAVALMLAVARRIPEGERLVRAGEWRSWAPAFMLGRDLHGARVGIVGGGRIGGAVARRLEGFDCVVSTAGRGDREGLERLLSESDFVSLHLPLNAHTQGLIGVAELQRMKPTAYLVNTARGPIVDAQALGTALAEGWIAGAALDVTDPEPLPGDHPLLEAPNLVVVPHVGSATHAAREAMAERAVDNLLAGLGGRRMPSCANPEVYAEP